MTNILVDSQRRFIPSEKFLSSVCLEQLWLFPPLLAAAVNTLSFDGGPHVKFHRWSFYSSNFSIRKSVKIIRENCLPTFCRSTIRLPSLRHSSSAAGRPPCLWGIILVFVWVIFCQNMFQTISEKPTRDSQSSWRRTFLVASKLPPFRACLSFSPWFCCAWWVKLSFHNFLSDITAKVQHNRQYLWPNMWNSRLSIDCQLGRLWLLISRPARVIASV